MRRLDRLYRDRLAEARRRTVHTVAARYANSIELDAIVDSYGVFSRDVAPIIEAGQAAAQLLSAAYLAALGGKRLDPDETIAGTTRAGKPLVEGMAAFGSMMLGAIGNGSSADEAVSYGATLAEGFADFQVTTAADRETERQTSSGAWQWEGIVQPGSCDPCMDNEGVHDASEEFYRHNDCNCDRTWLPPIDA